MKLTRLLIPCIVAALLVASISSLVNAQSVQTVTSTQDCGDAAVVNAEGINMFAYDVIQNVEMDGVNGCAGWISGRTYHCNWTIRLDYINPAFINGSSYILFYLPSPMGSQPIDRPVVTNVTAQPVKSQVQLNSAEKTGILSATFIPENDSVYFDLWLRFAVYINGVNCTSGLQTGCRQDPTISTEVFSSADAMMLAFVPEFPFAPMVLGLLATVSVFLLVVKRRKLIH
jgi:hypothetical protein